MNASCKPFAVRPCAFLCRLCLSSLRRLSLLIVVGCGVAGVYTAAIGAEGAIPVATAVRIETQGSVTRLIFQLSEAAPAVGFLMANPDRVIVDLPEVNFQIEAAAGRRKSTSRLRPKNRQQARTQPLSGIVSSYRFGLFAPGKSRIVIDLTGPAKILRATTEASVNGSGARLVIELAVSDRTTFAAAARPRQMLEVERPLQSPVPAAHLRPLIVLDPGHGGLDSGAHASTGALEKDVVFDFSKALQASLETKGRYRVLLTRTSDIFVPLAERVKIARAAGAALFVSIHADTLSDEPGVSGATVYTVSEKASDRQAARVAEQENDADSVAGSEPGEDESGVSDILFDLARRETRAYSIVFARTLVGYFKEVSRLNKNPHRAAGFRVLKAPDVPSVLLELGYLSSEKDLANLIAPEWRGKAAKSVVRAIDQFFQTQQTGMPARTAEAPTDSLPGSIEAP